MADKTQYAQIALEGPGKISVTFPKGVKAAITTRVPVDALLAVLQRPEADVEGQSRSAENVTCVPGSG